MTPMGMNMMSKEDLVDKISNFLNADGDLDFLMKLAPMELVLLASHLRKSQEQESAR